MSFTVSNCWRQQEYRPFQAPALGRKKGNLLMLMLVLVTLFLRWNFLNRNVSRSTFHLRTTILPAEEDMPEVMRLFKNFNDEFMNAYAGPAESFSRL